MRINVRAVLLTWLTAASLVGPAQAHASGWAAFEAEAHLDCLGCGVSVGAADFWLTGAVNGETFAAIRGLDSPNATAAFTIATESPSRAISNTGAAP